MALTIPSPIDVAPRHEREKAVVATTLPASSRISKTR